MTPQFEIPPFAVLWDMDGVIVDSGSYHFRSWKMALPKRGIAFSEDDFWRTFGQRNDTIIADILGPDVPAEQVKAIGESKEICYRELIAQEGIAPLPGTMEWLRNLHDRGIPQAVVSSAPPENIAVILQALEAGDLFQTLISGADVVRGKPDPEPFLTAAERLGIPPERCIVVEDAPAGIEAARRAGMHCLAVTTSHPAHALAAADEIVDSLADLPRNAFDELQGKE